MQTEREAVKTRARRWANALRDISDPLEDLPAVKKAVRGLLEVCKNEENLDDAAAEGAVGVVVPLLKKLNGGDMQAQEQPTTSGVEELERDICFILGLLAIKVEHQSAICEAGALPTLVSMIRRYAARNDVNLSGVPAQTCRRTSDAITNLAHENNSIKNKVRQEGGIPPLVSLLHSVDPKVQRAVAGSLRTLAFKNDENKNIIVDLGSLPLLIQMLRSDDTTIHYEAVGVIGNLVHSSAPIKRRVLEEGALQPVINLLSSSCTDSQREAALLLGQFATAAEGDYKHKIVQRGAVPPLIDMLGNDDNQPQLREMAAFALGRLAQNTDNQAGIVAQGGLSPLLDLLETCQSNLQHNAAFALYGLSDNEDNLLEFVREGAVQRINECELVVQASRDCVNKLMKRLQDKLGLRILGQILYVMQSSQPSGKQRIAIALSQLTTKEQPSGAQLRLMFLEKKGLDILLEMVQDPHQPADMQKQAAKSLYRLAESCGAADRASVDDIAPQDPNLTILGAHMVNNPQTSDVTFVVEGRPFHAHRVQLLNSSEIFKTMFDGHYREKDASTIPIPNIRWEVFEKMMYCCYTGGKVHVPPELAQELLEVSDQYMLESLKHLCEQTITEQLAPDNVSAAFDLAENYNALELSKQCALYCLREHSDVAVLKSGTGTGKVSTAGYSILLQKLAPRLKEAITDAINAKADAMVS
ncbi:ARM REPEAT PROTEIN INTERACTING WITH ABF2-like isoform B [Micractinium conductrix]|uniref:ARM REPEAT PROTEIN INTERACTING WITH ABF2-like isoform B n=1 Tax=Micractinium conductrix TaxID=554055 RepID=A0A2P6VAI1_9CHLO|nr:ARM REPEAT PROTEIN INTERACTING WITH ABF2-like isoform B [Micractinium conductrix]|eukprot:PSC71051.1 ARM REPEAT PROTEIN INTERACTING WITH ABF2-like isoform B [Micractinium conductrix]